MGLEFVDKEREFMKVTIIDEKKIKTEDIPQIIHRIFSICKEDYSFPHKKEMSKLDDEASVIKKKMKVKEEFIKKALKFESQMKKRLSEVQDQNLMKREKILESLGSELE
jgi:hypothetical protein